MGGWPSPSHWLIVLLIAVLLSGIKKIPEFVKGSGRGIKTSKNEVSNEDEATKNAHKIEEKQSTTNHASTDADIDEVRRS